MPVHVHSSRTAPALSNQAATQLIKDLLKSSRNANKPEIIRTALQIYGQITEHRNHRPINALLNFCSRLKEHSPITTIWSDILKIKSGLNVPLLFRCCVEGQCTTESVTVLKWMNSPRFELQRHDLKDHSKAMVKLIANNKRNHSVLRQIHALIDWTIFEDDIFIKTALINAYGECHDLTSARNLFSTVPLERKDSITIGVMMKALLRNEQNEELLSLYDHHTELHNDVIHMFALQAVINSNHFERGQRIIDGITSRNDSDDPIGHRLQNTMINFYGHFGDIERALSIFNDVAVDDRNHIANINVMLKSYVHNGRHLEALRLFDQHRDSANDITFTFALKACLSLNDFEQCD